MKNKFYIMDARDCLELLEKKTIKTIYIDPPYNTKSNNFEYKDNHTNWDSMIKELLLKSKDILREDGVIFISIDDSKMFELKIMCDEVFGKNNFLGMFVTRQATRSNSKHINTIHEYILSYSKNKNKASKFSVLRLELPIYKNIILNLIENTKKNFNSFGKDYAEKELKKEIKNYSKDENFMWLKNYNLVDDNGEIYFAKDLSTPSKPNELHIEEIGLNLPKLRTRGWSSKEKIINLYKENKLVYKNSRPYEKQLLKDSRDSAMSILNFYSRQGKHDLEKLGLSGIFQTPKPVELIKYLIKISTEDNDEILDFFAGSGTTAQAVIELNNEEKTNRIFKICQIREKIKNNKKVEELLRKESLDNDISSLPILRLRRLKKIYNFEYELEKTP